MGYHSQSVFVRSLAGLVVLAALAWLTVGPTQSEAVSRQPTTETTVDSQVAPLADDEDCVEPGEPIGGQVDIFNRPFSTSEIADAYSAGTAIVLGSVSLDPDGVLDVLGTQGADDILLRLDANHEMLEVDDLTNGSGTDYSFQLVQIHRVRAVLYDGDDRIIFDDSNGSLSALRPLEIDAGDGDDVVIPSTGRLTAEEVSGLGNLSQRLRDVTQTTDALMTRAQNLQRITGELAATDGATLMQTAERLSQDAATTLFPAALGLCSFFDSDIRALVDQLSNQALALEATDTEVTGRLEDFAANDGEAFIARIDELTNQADQLDENDPAFEVLMNAIDAEAEQFALDAEQLGAPLENASLDSAQLQLTDAVDGEFNARAAQVQVAGDTFNARVESELAASGALFLNRIEDAVLTEAQAINTEATAVNNQIESILGAMLEEASSPAFPAAATPSACQTTNSISGGPGSNLLLGTPANDFMSGLGGNDLMLGFAGDDEMHGGDGIDVMDGGTGNDCMYGEGKEDLMIGDDGDDIMYGGGISPSTPPDLSDVMFGFDGDDTMHGNQGETLTINVSSGITVDIDLGDFMSGNSGMDKMFGDESVDFMSGDSDADEMHGGAELDIMVGFDGNDVMWGDGGGGIEVNNIPIPLGNFMFGNHGTDTMHGGDYPDFMWGNADADTMQGAGGPDLMWGDHGDDQVNGDSGGDFLWGGDDVDTMHGGDGRDVMNGDEGDDVMNGDAGPDVMAGERGDDQVNGDKGIDILWGNEDADKMSGGDNFDLMYGNRGEDLMNGDGGIDLMWGNEDADQVNGDNGLDLLEGNDGADLMHGGNGSDVMTGNGGSDEMYGDDGIDVLWGNEEPDQVNGNNSLDFLHGNEGADTMRGGDGPDVMNGERGNDVMNGDDGVDFMSGNEGADEISGDKGFDVLWGNEDADNMHGGDGLDVMYGYLGNDAMYGDNDSDFMKGGAGDDLMYGGGGTDLMFGQDGNDCMFGEAGVDFMFGGENDDQMDGGSDSDVMEGNQGHDRMLGSDGADLMLGRSEDDEMDGGNDNDRMYGNPGNDRMAGRDGDDKMWGDRGDDFMDGGNGDDRMRGNRDDDTMCGGPGNNSVRGGRGTNHFPGSCPMTVVLRCPCKITIIKNAVPDDPQDFTFITTGGLAPSNFTLDDDPSSATPTATRAFIVVPPGAYTIMETPQPGWIVTVTCTGAINSTVTPSGNSVGIVPAGGEDIVCTFTNTPMAPPPCSITIIKDAVPNSPQDFTFTTSGAPATFTLDDDGNNANPFSNEQTLSVVCGSPVVITERPEPGWSLASIVCLGGSGAMVDLSTGTAIVFGPTGEPVICTFTNFAK